MATGNETLEPYRLVLVEWLDSYGASENWTDLEIVSTPAPLTCRSVGWLVFENKDCLVIVPHIADVRASHDQPRQGCGEMTIPVAAIVEIIDLGFKENVDGETQEGVKC